jgi:hypothetical protein
MLFKAAQLRIAAAWARPACHGGQGPVTGLLVMTNRPVTVTVGDSDRDGTVTTLPDKAGWLMGS